MLVADLKSRKNQWDEDYNHQGVLLQKWASRNNFRTARLPDTTFASHSVKSRVDLIFHRSPVQPSLTVQPRTEDSEDRSITTELAHVSNATMHQVPLSVAENKDCQRKVTEKYESTIPKIDSAVRNVGTPASLKVNAHRLFTAILQPCTRFHKPRSDRFWYVLTHVLDRKAKSHIRLIRFEKEVDLSREKCRDREIKRDFRKNLLCLKTQVGDLVA